AGGGHGYDAALLPAFDEVVVRDRVDVEVGELGALGVVRAGAAGCTVGQVLDPVEAVTPLDGVDELLERELPLAAYDEVRVLHAFLGQEARVGAAHDRDRPRFAHPIGEPVRL